MQTLTYVMRTNLETISEILYGTKSKWRKLEETTKKVVGYAPRSGKQYVKTAEGSLVRITTAKNIGLNVSGEIKSEQVPITERMEYHEILTMMYRELDFKIIQDIINKEERENVENTYNTMIVSLYRLFMGESLPTFQLIANTDEEKLKFDNNIKNLPDELKNTLNNRLDYGPRSTYSWKSSKDLSFTVVNFPAEEFSSLCKIMWERGEMCPVLEQEYVTLFQRSLKSVSKKTLDE